MEIPGQAGGSNSISAASGIANKSAILFRPLVILSYSSAVSRMRWASPIGDENRPLLGRLLGPARILIVQWFDSS